jgi:L-threonylcarbamoyladenylate synthase
VGVESTVIDTTQSPMVVLRPGGVTIEQLRQIDPSIRSITQTVHQSGEESGSEFAPRAPGMKYCHYAPRAPVYMAESDDFRECQSLIASLRSSASKIALMTSLAPEAVAESGADAIVLCGRFDDAASVAHHLYAKLREFDEGRDELGEMDAIVCFGFPGKGVGEAVLNRLGKASRKATDAQVQIQAEG